MHSDTQSLRWSTCSIPRLCDIVRVVFFLQTHVSASIDSTVSPCFLAIYLFIVRDIPTLVFLEAQPYGCFVFVHHSAFKYAIVPER